MRGLILPLFLAATVLAAEPSFPQRPDGVAEIVVDEASLVTAADRRRINAVARELRADK
ncbi:MAG: hypothetical protein ACYTEZ_00015 [Planctomycetota bacterium]|jgi:hypothetical protein